MNTIEEIKKKVKQANLSGTKCKPRPIGCPMQNNCTDELQQLSKYEFHAAFLLGLIGNNGHDGSIIKNAQKY